MVRRVVETDRVTDMWYSRKCFCYIVTSLFCWMQYWFQVCAFFLSFMFNDFRAGLIFGLLLRQPRYFFSPGYTKCL